MDGRPDAAVGRAAADVPAHRLVDVAVGRRRVARQERRRRHDLAGLAVAALRYVDLLPGELHGMGAVLRQALDRRDLLALGARDRHAATALRLAVDVHGAGPAEGPAAAELGALEVEFVAEYPEQGHLRRRVDRRRLAVQREGDCHEFVLLEGHCGAATYWLVIQ